MALTETEELTPPENFSMVESEIPEDSNKFYIAHGIKTIRHGLDGNKWPHKELNITDVCDILKDVLNKENQPLLIHCNKGKHRTGSVVGCIRKIRSWALTAIINEYCMFAFPKARLEDQIFIETFEVSEFNTYLTAHVNSQPPNVLLDASDDQEGNSNND